MPWTRIISAAVAIPLALVAVLLGGWAFTLAFGLLVVFGELEYFNLVMAKGITPASKITITVSLLLLLACQLETNLADAVLPLAGTFICFYLLFRRQVATISDIAASILGLFYGGYLPSFWIRLRGLDVLTDWHWAIAGFSGYLSEGCIYVILAFTCIWASDIGAYVTGKTLGRTKLSEISPKKTVEGTIGGLLCCLGTTLIWAYALHWQRWYSLGIVLGVLIGVAGLLGDLTESMMKRDAGVKDSGQIMPGHGGILDRADSYVFTAPLVYYFMTLILPLLNQIPLPG
ncbi:MAG: phosphatidate cytidylyltransferase [Pseudanabaena sp. ELA607]